MKTKKPSKPNISALAAKHGVSRTTLQSWQKSGFDLSNEKALVDRVAAIGRKDSGPVQDLKSRKLKLECERLQVALERDRGELVPRSQVEEEFVMLGALVRSYLNRMIGTTPGELEGLRPAQIQTVLAHRVDEVLTAIHENRPLCLK